MILAPATPTPMAYTRTERSGPTRVRSVAGLDEPRVSGRGVAGRSTVEHSEVVVGLKDVLSEGEAVNDSGAELWVSEGLGPAVL